MWWLESVLGIVVLKWEFSVLEIWNIVIKLLLPWTCRLWPVQGTVWGSPLGSSLEGQRMQEGWTFSKNNIWKAQEQASPMSHKTSEQGRKLAWMNRELLIELKEKKYTIFGRGGKWLRKITRVSLGYAGRKSERPKAQLEFSLASATRENIFFFPNTLTESQGELQSFIACDGKHCHQGWGKGWGTWCLLCFSL